MRYRCTCVSYILRVWFSCFYLLLLHQNPPQTWGFVCVVLGVGVISVIDAVAFLACVHRVSSLPYPLHACLTLLTMLAAAESHPDPLNSNFLFYPTLHDCSVPSFCCYMQMISACTSMCYPMLEFLCVPHIHLYVYHINFFCTPGASHIYALLVIFWCI